MIFLNCQQQLSKNKYSINSNPDIVLNKIPSQFRFKMQRQRPGSGELNVACLHVGPTLVMNFK